MADLTKEYLDKKLDNQTAEIKSYVDGRVSSVEDKIDNLARMTANGLSEIKAELDVREEMDDLKQRMTRIEHALNIKS
ncbi:MAG: hypothetical protein AAB461_00950 [Patescibacteria group bacterium]